jgi:hypothetical protein
MNVHFITPEDGDWIRMYIDGQLVAQGHSLCEERVAAAILGSAQVTSEEGRGDSEAYDDFCERYEQTAALPSPSSYDSPPRIVFNEYGDRELWPSGRPA